MVADGGEDRSCFDRCFGSRLRLCLVKSRDLPLRLLEQSHCARCWRPLRVSTVWPGPRLAQLPPSNPTDRALVVLQCGHVYHSSCCDKYLTHCSACHVFIEKIRPLMIGETTKREEAGTIKRDIERRDRGTQVNLSHSPPASLLPVTSTPAPRKTSNAPQNQTPSEGPGEVQRKSPSKMLIESSIETSRATLKEDPLESPRETARQSPMSGRSQTESASKARRRIAELQGLLDDIAREAKSIRNKYGPNQYVPKRYAN